MNQKQKSSRWLISTLLLLAFGCGYFCAVLPADAQATAERNWSYFSDGNNNIMRIDTSEADPVPERFTYSPPGFVESDACWKRSALFTEEK
ncbi:MAG: hypothetical protein DSY92_02100 [Planctomycetota bacterium]|nr:MAG: hypothetical protein DSY92_02100 [Planctomycetota bacterium]